MGTGQAQFLPMLEGQDEAAQRTRHGCDAGPAEDKGKQPYLPRSEANMMVKGGTVGGWQAGAREVVTDNLGGW